MHKKDMDTLDLFNELMFQKFAVDRTSLIHRMMGLSVLAYVALFYIEEETRLDDQDKVFVRDLSDHLTISMMETAKIVDELQEQELVDRAYEGDGSEGTYVYLTEHGKAACNKQRCAVVKKYRHVVEQFGKDRLVELLRMLEDLDLTFLSVVLLY